MGTSFVLCMHVRLSVVWIGEWVLYVYKRVFLYVCMYEVIYKLHVCTYIKIYVDRRMYRYHIHTQCAHVCVCFSRPT